MCMHAQSLAHVQLFVTQWTVAHQVSLSMGFSRQEHWSRLPCPPPGDLPNPGIKPASLTSPVLAGSFFTSTVPFPYTLLVQVLAPLHPAIVGFPNQNPTSHHFPKQFKLKNSAKFGIMW